MSESFAKKKRIRNNRPRVIVTTDGEADDRASMVRFLLTCNEFDVEGIINSSSQFHWVGGQGWNTFHPVEWVKEYIELYGEVYDNLRLHSPDYPTPDYLLSKWKVGNIESVGEDDIRTEGAELIAKVLMDKTDDRPVWLQAWGGCNTISRALKIIQEDYPERMEEAAAKMRLFLIWEQDQTYQDYIRPNWEKYNIPTIISDQFDCMAYIWPKVLPSEVKSYFEADWMTKNILTNHGPLCSVYENNAGAFNAEGDTPSFLHSIPTGLRNMENPGYGGWGGRYVPVRNNVWMDPLPGAGYKHPDGQISIHNSWSKMMENWNQPDEVTMRTEYFKPIWRWLPAIQNDFAARAEWCVKDYASANHHPVIGLKKTPLNIKAKAGSTIKFDASGSEDPDADKLHFRWSYFYEAGTYEGKAIEDFYSAKVKFKVPDDVKPGETIHVICEVSNSGRPSLTRYQRVINTIID
ncbi:nucleoside hydrolase-like domain-containing protein [Carboxylicivirga caseinilyticus]|uniref:nucleoside hydrolase-like domain-containing protein n=1 Tax=Carboxylicivirga caseinilyticus TaxID=3417572 RepID=UPI003D342A07